ncbi:class I SAM-dependent methyltransferase [Flagellimonas pelagia]|uniref:Class I SAM-dependent methyltransferase n=1 Tax=Flagellimonas pelagia TaxID=2306998 RepID=A0A3A1NLH4_9FLAO|nr:class I SAM-dependent methyltransferase [Allomuricauda maritima]RIV44537.1 class I SAM-dependent methyltransferase [Allomuricauda maritima]TXJ94601.1 class I SAM-dependent methyltransferase [Allomuricauda maritima]
MDRKAHWQQVYETKSPDEVSWTQKRPSTSLEFIESFRLDKDAKIIDVGGGDSNLVDFLLEEGYSDITVLDISAKALEKAQNRLGDRANKVHWVVNDIVDYHPTETFDLWHDRAAFHFLTDPEQINTYLKLVNQHVSQYLVLGTFSEAGPTKCSGLEIQQYSENSMTELFSEKFDKINCQTVDHTTPFGTKQNFLFCAFRKRNP